FDDTVTIYIYTLSLHDALPICFTSLPTIWDELAAAGVTGNYYYSNVPFTALWGTRYVGISKLYDEFLAAAASGTLPAVSFVDPRDRKSTRLNSSHRTISYAVFC